MFICKKSYLLYTDDKKLYYSNSCINTVINNNVLNIRFVKYRHKKDLIYYNNNLEVLFYVQRGDKYWKNGNKYYR